jgi:hypothetical protein
MNKVLIAVSVVMLAYAAQAQTVNCHNPTWPCAVRQTNAQLTVIPLPSPMPNFGNVIGANTTWRDPVRGTLIVRCTDAGTGPGQLHSWEVTGSGGAFENDWNSDQTLLHVIAMASGHFYTLAFNAAAMTCTPINPFSAIGTGTVWSNVNSRLDYVLVGTKVYPRTYDQVNPVTVPPVIGAPLFDFASCPGLATLKPRWNTTLQVTGDDSLFAVGFSDQGLQDTGDWLAMYQPATNGCQVWNTLTGQITASGFGVTGQVSAFFPFTLHETAMGPNGIIEAAIGNTCTGCPKGGPFIYKAGTLQAGLLTSQFGGHNNMGWLNYCNIINQAAIVCRPWNNLTQITQVTRNTGVRFPPTTQSHMSWQGVVDVLDTYPMIMGSSTTGVPGLVITSPLQQALWLANMDGTFSLIAPLLTSGIEMPGQLNFRTAFGIHTVGKKGIVAWSSDDMGGFGNADGVTPTCVLGTVGATQCASQILIAVPGQ